MTINKSDLYSSITTIAVPVVAVAAIALAAKFITNIAVTGIVIAGIIAVAAPIITAAGYKIFNNFCENKSTSKEDIINIVQEADKKELLARIANVAVPVLAAVGIGLAINFISDTAIKVAVIAGIAAVAVTVIAPALYETFKDKIELS